MTSALASAASFGAGDFSGGVASKTANTFGVLTVARVCGVAVMVGLALATHEAFPAPTAVLWASGAGVIGGVSLAAFYRALATGTMGIVAPITSVVSAALPVLVAMATIGRPTAHVIAGMGLALVALWLISQSSGAHGRTGLWLALVAGVGFGLFLVCIRQAGPDATYWPVAIAAACSFVLSIGALIWQRAALPTWRELPVVIGAGVLDSFGNAFFVLASRHGRLDVTAVLSSLYPAVTVVLARVLLKERLTRTQTIGMLIALAAVALIAVP